MVRLLFLAPFVFLFSAVQSQQDPASVQMSLGIEKVLQGDYLNAAEHYGQAGDIYLKRNDIHRYVDSEFQALDCLLHSSELITCAKRLDRLEAFVRDRQGSFRPHFLDTASTSLALFKVEFLTRTGNVTESIRELESLQSVISAQNAKQPSPYHDQRLIQISLMLANAYAQQGDCENTRAFSIQSLSAMRDYQSIYVEDGVILQPYLLLARCYTNNGDTVDARNTYSNVLELLDAVGSKKSQRSFRAFEEIFEYYLKSHLPDSAALYLTRLGRLEAGRQHRAEILMLTGDYRIATGNIPAAEDAYQNALQVINQQPGYRNELLAQCYLALGNVSLRLNKPGDALNYYHQGLYRMTYSSIAPKDLLQNPKHSSLFRQRSALKIIQGKAAALDILAIRERNPAYADAAWQTIRLGVRFMEELRTGYQAESDKSVLIEDSYPVFEHAIDLCFQFFTHRKETHWIDSALLLMEESKALNLRDAVLHGHARKFAGIPDALLTYENNLRHEIAGKEASINAYRKSAAYLEATEIGYINELNAKKTEYRNLLLQYERDHPRYYELKHKPIAVTTDDIRAVLPPDQSMLEYFIGDSAMYLIQLDPNGEHFYRIPKDFPLEALVRQYRSSLKTFSEEKSMLALSQYSEAAFQLYTKLFPGDITTQSVLIIPDGVLGYLSFSSLLKTKPDDPNDPRGYDYLLWHHDIGYSYSANLFLELKGRIQNASGKALICAPEFSERSNVPSLEYNLEEGQRIRKLTGGRLLSGTDCTVRAFHASLQEEPFNVLHLATHGYANDENGDASYLVFSDADPDSAFLYARDLYNLDLPLDLVYLSACETGTGELRRGEGLISLARGFFYAGIQSIVTTLWQVEDNRSAQLSFLFYTHLRNGTRKDQAISDAQRDYIRALDPTEKIYAHPVYWSALIPVGNMDVIQISPSSFPTWLVWIIAGMGLVMIALVGVRMFRR